MLKNGESDHNTTKTKQCASCLQVTPDCSLAAWRYGEGSCQAKRKNRAWNLKDWSLNPDLAASQKGDFVLITKDLWIVCFLICKVGY